MAAPEKPPYGKSSKLIFCGAFSRAALRPIFAQMNLLFDIQGSGRATNGLFLCEWGAGYCCAALLDADSGLPHRLRYWSVEEPLPANELEALLDGLRTLADGAGRKVLCSAFPEAVAVPARLPGDDVLTALYPVRGQEHEDRVGEWQLNIHYAFPAAIDAALRSNFPGAEYYHAFSPSLKRPAGTDAARLLQVHFAPGQFRVVARRDGQLQLAQMYRYETPLDVVYYLLRIAAETGLPATETTLALSGLIDEESALYRELHQYFSAIHFIAPENLPSEEGRPAHFFTSIYNLAQCVS
jgi:hypothetical protein